MFSDENIAAFYFLNFFNKNDYKNQQKKGFFILNVRILVVFLIIFFNKGCFLCIFNDSKLAYLCIVNKNKNLNKVFNKNKNKNMKNAFFSCANARSLSKFILSGAFLSVAVFAQAQKNTKMTTSEFADGQKTAILHNGTAATAVFQCPDASFDAPSVCVQQIMNPLAASYISYQVTTETMPNAATLGANFVHDFEVYAEDQSTVPATSTLLASAYNNTYFAGGTGFISTFPYDASGQIIYKICHKVRYDGMVATACPTAVAAAILPDLTTLPDAGYNKILLPHTSTAGTPYTIDCTATSDPAGGVHTWEVREATNGMVGGIIASLSGVGANFFTSSVYLTGQHYYLITHSLTLNGCQISITNTTSQNRLAPTIDGNIQSAASKLAESSLEKSNLSVSPNPTVGDLNLEYTFEGETTGETTLMITDILGRQIEMNTLEQNNGTMRINTSEWAAGFYQIAIQNGSTRLTKKVSVVK